MTSVCHAMRRLGHVHWLMGEVTHLLRQLLLLLLLMVLLLLLMMLLLCLRMMLMKLLLLHLSVGQISVAAMGRMSRMIGMAR